jgi:hypothetical protein
MRQCLHLAQCGIVSGNDDVAHHGQFTAASQRSPVDSSNQRFPDVLYAAPVPKQIPVRLHRQSACHIVLFCDLLRHSELLMFCMKGLLEKELPEMWPA